MPMDIEYLYRTCHRPHPSSTDIEAWGTLEGSTSNESEVKVGLFGYDISCIATYCAASDEDNYCPLIEAMGLDGLAFGMYFKRKEGSSDMYCGGFHNEEDTDVAICVISAGNPANLYWNNDYTVATDYFTGTTDREDFFKAENYYGFSYRQFYSSFDDVLIGPDFLYSPAFRFIGKNENGGARWSVGDTIDLFYLEFDAEEMTENDGFELLGATTLSLTAAGIALFSAVVM